MFSVLNYTPVTSQRWKFTFQGCSRSDDDPSNSSRQLTGKMSSERVYEFDQESLTVLMCVLVETDARYQTARCTASLWNFIGVLERLVNFLQLGECSIREPHRLYSSMILPRVPSVRPFVEHFPTLFIFRSSRSTDSETLILRLYRDTRIRSHVFVCTHRPLKVSQRS